MLKTVIEYTDFNDEEQTEEVYFHLSKSELIEMELGVDGGLGDQLKKIVAGGNVQQILAAFKKIVLTAYGVRSEDNKRFVKNQELTAEFESSTAFEAYYMQLLTDPTEATRFIKGVIPKDLANIPEIAELETGAEEPQKPWANRKPTSKELAGMSREDLLEVWQRDQS